ncbi:MAG: PAS domain S-box protein [Candidatus Rokubacteria bacterium]|nr:PAS domain S-box protein [Candidatus Rokubacteria bacterium]
MADLGGAARLRAAFELSPTILAVSSFDDGRLLEVNEAFLRVTGWSREEVIGRPIPEIGFWIDPEVRRRGLDTLRAGGAVRDMEVRFRTKRGDEVVALLNADLVELDGRRCVITALMDITGRVRAEAALRESERRFAQLFHANPVPMTIVRLRDGVTLEVNEAVVRVSGYTREQMLGRTTPELDVWAQPEERRRLLERFERDGGVRDFEMLFRTRTGELRHMLVNAEVITYGGEAAVVNVVLDITERKQLEAQREARREEAESLGRAKDEFLAMLGHELRNPLGVIVNALAVLRPELHGAEAERVVALIGRQSRQLTRLVDDLLDVARATAGKVELRREVVDVREVVRRCLDALAQAGRTAGHHIYQEGEAVAALADPDRLEQVVANLVDNALKYTPAGGQVFVRTAREGDDAVLVVRDTGEGIRAELLGQIFDVFVQQPQALDRARGGLGLGLTLVKRLVELHGGSVTATSDGAGRGSEFTVRLAAAAGGAAAAGEGTADAPVSRRRVLVVEDNEDSREMLELMLVQAGHAVATAADGPGGLAKAAEFEPEVALIDVGLPGLDGYAVARALRDTPRAGAMRLIALTGYGQAEDRRKALEAGFDVHLTKPVDPERLVRLVGAV